MTGPLSFIFIFAKITKSIMRETVDLCSGQNRKEV